MHFKEAIMEGLQVREYTREEIAAQDPKQDTSKYGDGDNAKFGSENVVIEEQGGYACLDNH
jgi:hypothetical protein